MILSLIQKRRSIRKYLRKPVESPKIGQLLEAALRAPSSRGLNPWEFIVIDQPDLLVKASKAKLHGSAFLQNAPLAIVVCANPDRCDVWIEDASIAAAYIQLVSVAIGLGSCWIQIRERMHDEAKTAEEYLREILEIPVRLKVEAVVALGYPDEALPAHPKEELQYEKIYYNCYGVKHTFSI